MMMYAVIVSLFSLLAISTAVSLVTTSPKTTDSGDDRRRYDYESDSMVTLKPEDDEAIPKPVHQIRLRALRSIFNDLNRKPQSRQSSSYSNRRQSTKSALCFFTALPCRNIRRAPYP
uniref:Uncharacterized protein n=1 Tax=Panagrolaimus sp. JU765 TaxID=591449 RepID=A0AC34QVV8_9BILA